MWGARKSVLLYALAALVMGAMQLAGQILQTVDVNIVNQNFDPIGIRVVDDVCDVIVFEGRLLPNSSTHRSRAVERLSAHALSALAVRPPSLNAPT
jgi:hypothetical protein